LDEAHGGLLRVHKALIDHERVRYERERGPIGGPGAFLQVLIHDPWFAWLRPVSELVVRIDEFVASKETVDPMDGEALLAQARELLTPVENGAGFGGEYFRALQESEGVALAHAEWRLFAIRTGRKE
jgi:hypothetical protein